MFKWITDSLCEINSRLRRLNDFLSDVFDDFGAEYYYGPDDWDDEDDEDWDDDWY